MIDEYMEYLEENKLLWDEADELLSTQVLRHWWAGNWNVVLIWEWESLAKMEAGLEHIAKLTEKNIQIRKYGKSVRKKR